MSQSSTSHVSLRVINHRIIGKFLAKMMFGDGLIVERSPSHVWLHATAGEMRSGSEKNHSPHTLIHMRNLPVTTAE